MTPERWQRVEDLFHAASERPPADRARFLHDACAQDDTLRDEVESLLAQQEGGVLSDGLSAAAARVVGAASGSHAGRRLGPYVLGRLIGAGGMGEVYRAHDAKLGRDVAVKLLSAVSGRPALAGPRLARFEREARILAALSHPNIAAIYGLEEGDGMRGLVLELVEGPTLKERLASGALPLDTTLVIARQIADALSTAHQKGVVHRDLKPANIKITDRCVVKVLDFGLAKIDASDSGDAAAFPVLETSDGVVLGTVAYMSPEQARGQAVDKRTDVWAFGCLLYEMLTGTRPFRGETAADAVSAILGADPEWSRLPADTPSSLRRLLRRCLAKDPDRRLHDIADARIEIDDAIAGDRTTDDVAVAAARARTLWTVLPWLLSAVIATAAAGALLWSSVTPPAPRTPARAAIPLPPEISVFAIGRGSSVAVSPDGQRVVFAGIAGGRRQLFMRALDASEIVPIPGTDNGANPFFSPDGRWLGFTDNTPAGSLKTVPVEGGAAVTIVDSMGDGLTGFAVQSAVWALPDRILLSAINPRFRGLWSVPASGGSPERLTTPSEGEGVHVWHQPLPDGKTLLYTLWNNTGFDGGRIVVRSLEGGEPSVLVERASYGRVVSPDGRRGWLISARPEGLQASAFDLERLQVMGPVVPVLNGVLVNLSGGAQYSVSPSGLLAYVPGGLDEANKTAVWVDQQGMATDIGVIPGLGFQFRLSPDGKRLVRPGAGGTNRDLWVEDLERRGTPTRLTAGVVVNEPIWTPDGRRVIYVANGRLFWSAADGSGTQETLGTDSDDPIPGSVSRDGRTLAYHTTHAENGSDIWLLSLQGPRQSRLLLGTRFSEFRPRISPDGRWVAYKSNMSGAFEVYLTPITGGGRQIPVSKGGGHEPIWSPDGRELYYRTQPPETARGAMMAIAIDTARSDPVTGTPRVLFASTYQGNGDLSPDGRFLLLRPTPQESPSRFIQLVFNWFEELQARVPVP